MIGKSPDKGPREEAVLRGKARKCEHSYFWLIRLVLGFVNAQDLEFVEFAVSEPLSLRLHGLDLGVGAFQRPVEIG